MAECVDTKAEMLGKGFLRHPGLSTDGAHIEDFGIMDDTGRIFATRMGKGFLQPLHDAFCHLRHALRSLSLNNFRAAKLKGAVSATEVGRPFDMIQTSAMD